MKEIHFAEIDSTNRYLKDNYSSLEDMTLVTADYQSAGKGRGTRRWESNAGANLLMSLLIKDEKLYPLYRRISLTAALSVAQTLESRGVKKAMIKWPNDVYVEGRKICGILLESVVREQMECLIIGIGINVNQTDFADDLRHPATSLKLITGRETDLDQLKESCISQLVSNLDRLKQGYGFTAEITSRDYLAGMTVFHNGKKCTVTGINEDCSLRLSCDGQQIDAEAGEISFHQ